MSVSSVSLVSLLRDRMHWHQTRQKVLAENVANADTPGFRPRDLAAPKGDAGAGRGSTGPERTHPAHIAIRSGSGETGTVAAPQIETRPSGNAANLEDEMMKIAANQSEYQLAASLYQKSLSMLKSAAGVRGA